MVVYYFACSSGCSCILRSVRVMLHTVETIFSGTSSHSHSVRPRKLFCPLCKCPLVVVRAVVLCTLRCARMCAHLTLFHTGRRGWARLGGAQMCAHLLLSPDVHHSGAQKLETGQNAPVLVHECGLYYDCDFCCCCRCCCCYCCCCCCSEQLTFSVFGNSGLTYENEKAQQFLGEWHSPHKTRFSTFSTPRHLLYRPPSSGS